MGADLYADDWHLHKDAWADAYWTLLDRLNHHPRDTPERWYDPGVQSGNLDLTRTRLTLLRAYARGLGVDVPPRQYTALLEIHEASLIDNRLGQVLFREAPPLTPEEVADIKTHARFAEDDPIGAVLSAQVWLDTCVTLGVGAYYA